ncbi:MAG: TIM-barrel domain-containing protein [Prolixibacteraceae bacterium]
MKSLYLCIVFILLATGAFARAAYKIDGNNVLIELNSFGIKSKLLQVEIWSTNTVRIRTTMNSSFSNEPTLLGTQPNEPVKFKAGYSQANIEISTSGIQVNVAEDGIVRILSGIGRKLLVESNRTFEASTLEEGAYKITQKFYLNRGEHIYGFGQGDRQDRFTLRDKSFEVAQDQSSIASPVLLSEKGFALIWDNFSETHFEDTPGSLSLSSEIADEIDYFIINGSDWKTIITEIRNITGQAPMLPRWAFGFHLNPAAYSSQEALNAAINQYHLLDIPVEDKVVDQTLYLEEKSLTAKKENGRNLNDFAYIKLKNQFEQLLTSTERVVIPTHINIPGIQKYGTFTVAGEISQCWESLKCQICAGINSSYAGQPYWSTTLVGYSANQECSAEPLNELMVRWNQFAAFTPIYQGSPVGLEAWKAGNSSDPHFIAIKKAIQFRYRLLPYIYTTAYNVVNNNENIIRSLLYDYQKNENLHTNRNQFLFGPSLLVCPVTESTKQIMVTLPAETNWVNFWSGKTFMGGTDIKVDVKLDHIPLFVKQGSIIPLATVTKNSLDSLNAPMEIRVYGGANASFTLYEDQNDGKEFQDGKMSEITFNYSEKSNSLTIGSQEGEYPGMITNRIFKVILVSEQDGIGMHESTAPILVEYKGKKEKVKFE